MILGKKKERQIRCLHYCFIEISDWALRRLKTARDEYIREHGRGMTSQDLLNIERDWDQEIGRLMKLMTESGIDLQSLNHHDFFRDYYLK